MSTTTRIALGISVGVVMGNLLGFAAHAVVGPPQRPSPTLEQKKVAELEAAPLEDSAVSQAHRTAGIRFMELGQYEDAIEAFRAGEEARNPSPDLPRLIAIAEKLLLTSTPSEPAADPKQEPADPKRDPVGLLLVTTTPPKLTIRVDGKVTDMSPARIEVSPGRHRVAVAARNRVLHTGRYTVSAGGVVPLNLDLRDRLAQEARARAVPKKEAGSDKAEAVDTASKPDLDVLAGVVPSTVSELPTSASKAAAPGAVLEETANILVVSEVAEGPADTSQAKPEEEVSVEAPPQPKGGAPRKKPEPSPPPEPSPSRVSQDTVVRVVGSASRRLQSCYERQLARHPRLSGTISIAFEVNRQGRVENPKLDSDLDNQAVDVCVRRQLLRLRFPQHREPNNLIGDTRLSFSPDQ